MRGSSENVDADVLIVGAGPVGLGLAARLVHAGIETLVIDKDEHASTEWRASTFHPPTLEQLADTGLTDEMLAAGLVAGRYQLRDRTLGMVAEFDYSALREDTPYPFRLQLEQYKFVELATELVAASGHGEVRFGAEVVDIDQGADTVTARVRQQDGAEASISAAFVVGADGARSTVRRLLGLGFDGWTYDQRFLLISTDLPFERYIPDLCHVNYIADPDEFVMLLRIPEVWRVLVPVPENADAEDVATPHNLRRILGGVLGNQPDAIDASLLAHQLYQVHQRVVEKFNVGRVALIGDAAHVNSPMGGFGLNSGLQDSFDLAPRLVRLLRQRASQDTIDTELAVYSEGRRTVALDHVRRLSHQNTQMLMQTDEDKRAADRARLAAIAADPHATRRFLLEASMINAARQIGLVQPPVDASVGGTGQGGERR